MSAQKQQSAFTIVELLIVIIVIGVLAAVTTVAFNGLQARARASEAAAATSNSKKQLENYKTVNGAYPTNGNLSAADITNGSVTYQYTNAGSTYCLTGTSGNVSYKVTESTTPTAGGCAGHAQNGRALLTNMVTNPSFESNATSWSLAGASGYSATVSAVRAQSGSNSYAFTAGSPQADSYVETYINNVSPGTYTYSSYVYLTGSGATFSSRRVWFHCSSGSCSTSAEPNYDTGLVNQWQRLQKTVTVNTTANFRLRYYVPDASTMYIDAVMVTGGSTVYAYMDGNSTDWAWTGTVNNSTSNGPTP